MTFWMGKFAAELPADRHYCRNHMWCREVAGTARFGFTTYAVRLMQDVYFLDWSVEAGVAVSALQPIGHLETSKAVSDLFAPVTGTIARFNPDLLADPSGINADCHEAGWLFEMTGIAGDLLDVAAYHDFLAANWEKTQRHLKGKINLDD
jgi:glycine cleavage system H protein